MMALNPSPCGSLPLERGREKKKKKGLAPLLDVLFVSHAGGRGYLDFRISV